MRKQTKSEPNPNFWAPNRTEHTHSMMVRLQKNHSRRSLISAVYKSLVLFLLLLLRQR